MIYISYHIPFEPNPPPSTYSDPPNGPCWFPHNKISTPHPGRTLTISSWLHVNNNPPSIISSSPLNYHVFPSRCPPSVSVSVVYWVLSYARRLLFIVIVSAGHLFPAQRVLWTAHICHPGHFHYFKPSQPHPPLTPVPSFCNQFPPNWHNFCCWDYNISYIVTRRDRPILLPTGDGTHKALLYPPPPLVSPPTCPMFDGIMGYGWWG